MSVTTTRFTPDASRTFAAVLKNRSTHTTVSTPASRYISSSSRGVYSGFVWTTIPPARRTPKNAITNCGQFGIRRETRSPGLTPIFRSPPANRPAASSISRYVSLAP